MVYKKRLLNIILSFLIVVSLFHIVYHFAVFGTGFSSFYEKGISGLAVSKFPLGEELRENYQSTSLISKLTIAAEWSLVVVIILYIFIKNKAEMKKEVSEIKTPQKYRKTEKSTELDLFYNILKEKKHLRLSTVAKIFKVSKDIALEWAKTLEYGNLATIEYPRVGDPEIILNED